MSMPRLGVDAFRWRPGSTVGYLLGVVNADGTMEPLASGGVIPPIPADSATTRYVLSIDQATGLPAWYVLSDPTLAIGFGMVFGDSFGQD